MHRSRDDEPRGVTDSAAAAPEPGPPHSASAQRPAPPRPAVIPRRPPLRLRMVIALLVLVPAATLFFVWGTWLESGNGAAESLNSCAVALLVLFAAANLLLRRRKPQWAFSSGELTTIYFIIATCMGISGGVWQWGGSLAASIAYPIWEAGPGNRWADILWPNLPPGMVVLNRPALEGFAFGGSTAYRMEVLRAWLMPTLMWTAWLTATLWVTLCLSVIVRRRWSEEEKLPFPMTIVPLQIADPEARLFRERLLWLGVAISSGIGLLGVAHRFAPAVPVIPTYVDIGNFLSNNRPWDAIRGTALSWSPWEVGLCYLMPLDFAFSLVVFNLLWKAEYITSRWEGWLTGAWGGFPYGDQQNIGAYLALMISVVWLDRRYLMQVLRRALGLSSPLDDREDGLSYRTALLGLVGGLGFLWWMYARAGMTPPITAAFLFLYFSMVMVMSRLRAQIGPPAHWMYGTMPEFTLTQFPGTRAIGPRALGLIAMLRPFMYEQDANPVPIQLEGLRIAERGAMRARHFAYAIILAIPLIMISYFWASAHVGYRFGMGAKIPQDMLEVCRQGSDKLDNWVRDPGGPNWSGTISIGIGAVIALALMNLKLRMPSFPLHPMAFPLAFSWTIDAILPAVTISWVVKALLLRYGGLKAHRRALPFFLGLIIGDATVSFLWTIATHILRSVGK
jgi:hypothetical protein